MDPLEWSVYDAEAPVASSMPQLRDVADKTGFISRGAQGAVYTGVLRDGSRRPVAVKRLFTNSQVVELVGTSKNHLREVAVLSAVNHPNIVRLLGTASAPHGEVCLVMEPVATDVSSMLRDGAVRFTHAHRKFVLRSLLEAAAYLEERGFVHRDIKPSNVGIAADGTPKLLDFGSARPAVNCGHFTPVSATTTLTYSPPELLLGAAVHTPAVDMWGIGVTYAELTNGGRHLFHAQSQLEMLSKLFTLVGTPTGDDLAALSQLPVCQSFGFAEQPSTLEAKFGSTDLGHEGIELLGRMLCVNPARRITAAEALQHPYFTRILPAPAAAVELLPLLEVAVVTKAAGKQTTALPMASLPAPGCDLGDDGDDDDDGVADWPA